MMAIFGGIALMLFGCLLWFLAYVWEEERNREPEAVDYWRDALAGIHPDQIIDPDQHHRGGPR